MMRHVAPLLVILSLCTQTFAHDEDHEHDAWYSSLYQPDAPTVSCCGVADAYWCDTISVEDHEAYCTITDDRADMPLNNRAHVDIGTKIHIPASKLKWEQNGKMIGNPTGHAVVFLSYTQQVYCFVQAGGV